MRRSMLQLSEGIRLMASRRICRSPYRRADRGGAPFERSNSIFKKVLRAEPIRRLRPRVNETNCNCRLDCRCLAKAAEPASTPAPAGASANCKNACLAKGETLTQISKQHGVSVEDIQQLEQDRGCQETAGMPNDQNPLYDSAAGSGRVVGAPSHGPESAHKSDDDLLSNAKIVNIRYARKEAKTKTTNSSSMGA